MKKLKEKLVFGILIAFMLLGQWQIEQVAATETASSQRSITSGAEKGLMQYKTIPSTGNIRTLVVMVEFADTLFQEGITKEYLEEIMFAEPDKNSKNYPKESLNAWYQRSSFGKLSFYGDVVQITLPETRDYYISNPDNMGGFDSYIEEIGAKVRKLNLNWADYDSNTDYIMDALCFVIAGEYDSQWKDQMRFESFELNDTYSVKGYINCTEASMQYAANVIHEFGHGLGLPDLCENYEATTYMSGDIETTDMMSTKATELNALCKIMLGWIEEEQIQVIPYGTDLTTVSLDSYSKTGSCALLFLEEGEPSLFSEYYLVQYEDFYGNDIELAKMADNKEHLRIYHVDAGSLGTDNAISEKFIEAVDKDANEPHEQMTLEETEFAMEGYIWASTGEYNCGYVPGDELTPYSAPSTDKYPKDRLFSGPNVFSGLNIKDIQIKNGKASFQVFYERESSATTELSIHSSECLRGRSIYDLNFHGIANHDIWVADTSKKPYIRKKGDTVVITECNLDRVASWQDDESTDLNRNVFYISTGNLSDNPLEYDTEYEVVFPAGLFVTSYGEVSEEIVVSGIHTELDIWEFNYIDCCIEFAQTKYDYFGDGFITNKEGNMEIMGSGKYGGLYVCEIDPLSSWIFSEKAIISESELDHVNTPKKFGQGENERYWVLDGDRNIYIASESEGLLYSGKVNYKDAIPLGKNRIAICDSYTKQFYGEIFDLESLSGRVMKVTDSTTIFPMGEYYLLGEQKESGMEDKEPVYRLYNGEDAYVREMAFEGMNVKEVLEEEDGYLVFGNKDGSSYVYRLGPDFSIQSKYRIWKGVGISAICSLKGGYYIWLEDGSGYMREYILDRHFQVYSAVRELRGTAQKAWEKDGKQYLFYTYGSSDGFCYQKTSEIIIPEGKNNALEDLAISEQVILDANGYVEPGEVQSEQAYLESIAPKADETYKIEKFNDRNYLKVTTRDGIAARYLPMNCIHIWDAGEIVEEPTCVKKGKRRYACRVCSDGEKTEEVEVTHHVYAKEWTVDKEASCVKEGSKSHHCTNEVCTEKTDITVIPKEAHQWNEGEETVEATCMGKGVKTYTCTGCRDTRTEELAKLPHVFEEEWTLDKEATCSEEGSKSHHCTGKNCTEKQDITVVPKEAHRWDKGEETVEATCEGKGEKTYTCTNCLESRTEELAPLGHEYGTKWTIDKESDCTETGSKSHHCIRTGCDEKSDETELPRAAHHFGEGKVTTEATCTKAGVKIYQCSVCKVTRTEELAMQQHTYGTEWTVDTEASYVQEGYKSRHCTTSGCTAKADVTVLEKLTLKGTSLKKITGKKKSFTVKWKKQTKETNGYELSYSTSKNFKNEKSVTIKKNKTISTTIKKLKTNKKYYVRIRTYKIVEVNGTSTKVYSEWSKAKMVKVK